MRVVAKLLEAIDNRPENRLGELKRWYKNLAESISIDPSTKVSPRATIGVPADRGSITVGRDCQIHSGAKLLPRHGDITLGDKTTVNPYTLLYGQGGLTIGDGVRIASHTTVIPSNHRFEDPETPIHQQGESREGIEIGDDVWIGTGCRILDGVTVGDGTVVAAGAVVTDSIPPYSVAGGVPASVIRSRGEAPADRSTE